MSTPQPSPELTTRDVLQQIDHRLSLIETDVRENHTKIEAKIEALDSKFEAKIDAFDRKFEAKIDALEAKTEAKFNALDSKIDAFDRKFEGKMKRSIANLKTGMRSIARSKARSKSKYGNCAASSTANLIWLSDWSSPLGCR